MTADKDMLPCFLRGEQLFLSPCKCFPGQAAEVVRSVRIQHQQPCTFIELCRIAQGIRVQRKRLIIAESRVNLPEFVGKNGGYLFGAFTQERIAFSIQIVIAGQNEHRNPGRLGGGKLFCQGEMARLFSVKRQVAGEDQSVRLKSCGFFQKRACNFIAVFGYLAVSRFHDLPEESAVIRQARREIVQIRCREHPVLSGGRVRPVSCGGFSRVRNCGAPRAEETECRKQGCGCFFPFGHTHPTFMTPSYQMCFRETRKACRKRVKKRAKMQKIFLTNHVPANIIARQNKAGTASPASPGATGSCG